MSTTKRSFKREKQEQYRTNFLMPVTYKEAMEVVERETMLRPSSQLRLALREWFEKNHKDILEGYEEIWER